MRQWFERVEVSMLGSLVAGWLLVSLYSAPAWHDTAEFATVGHLFTTSHSPGHPLYSLLSGGFTWLCPVGDVAVRSSLFSAFVTVVTFYFLAGAVRILIPQSRAALYWLAGGVLAPPILMQAIRPEVYALHLCLFALSVYCCARWWMHRDARWFVALALSIGFAGANHSYLALIPLPLILWLAYLRRTSVRILLLGVVSGLLGLATYIFLPLRASTTEMGWGSPQTFAETWQMIRAAEWNKNLAPEGLDWLEQLIDLMVAQIEWLGPMGFALWSLAVCVGVLRAVRRRQWVALTCYVLALVFVILRGLIEVDYQNPDLMGYLAPGFMMTIFGTCVAFNSKQRWGQLSATASGLIFMIMMMTQSQPLPPESTAQRYARGLLDEVPSNGTLVLSLYSSWFWTWYLRGVEGVRPDVGVVFRGRVKSAWHARRLRPNFPKLADAMSEYPQSFTDDNIRWEPGVGFYEDVAELSLKPVGLTLSSTQRRPPAAVEDNFKSALVPKNDEDQRYSAFIRYEHLRYLVGTGRYIEHAKTHASYLKKYAGEDPLVKQLLESKDAPSEQK